MDVAVKHKRGKRLRSIARPSILGDGMLERARATSLGLLGLTAAIGLTIVALVFNQAWPLVAGGPVPPLPEQRQGLEKAKVVAGAGDASRSSGAGRPVGQGAAEGPAGKGDGAAPIESSAPPATTELVVTPTAPAPSAGGDAPRGSAKTPRGGSKTGSSPAEPAPASPPTAASQPAKPAPSTPPAVEEPESPPATVSEAPPTSSVPPWSNGKGHAYGRSDDHRAGSLDGDPPGHGHDK